MNTSITIQAIRATLDQLEGQLTQYLREGESNMEKFQSHVSASSAAIAVEATINDIVGEGVALPGTGSDIFTRAINKRRNELDVIKKAQEKVIALKEDLIIVGHRIGSGN